MYNESLQNKTGTGRGRGRGRGRRKVWQRLEWGRGRDRGSDKGSGRDTIINREKSRGRGSEEVRRSRRVHSHSNDICVFYES